MPSACPAKPAACETDLPAAAAQLPTRAVLVAGAVAGHLLHPPTGNARYRYAVPFQRTEGFA